MWFTTHVQFIIQGMHAHAAGSLLGSDYFVVDYEDPELYSSLVRWLDSCS